jgi:GT2 family glycosyltransferase
LVVIDNASRDAAPEIIQGIVDPRITLLRNKTNTGFAKAANRGLRFAAQDGADFTILINNDTTFESDFLRRFLAARSRLGADVIAPRIMNSAKPSEAWYAGGHFEQSWVLANVHESFDAADPAEWRIVEYASGCCLGLTRRVLEKVGLFDESFFVYWEDADLCQRLAASDTPIHYVRDPFMLHEGGGASGGEHTPAHHRLFYRSQMQFLRKHRGMRYAVASMARLLMREKDRPGSTLSGLWVIARAMLEGLRAPLKEPAKLD